MMTKSLTTILAAFGLSFCAQAFTVSTIYSDYMVLQRDRPIKVTGSGAPGETVEVTFDGETAKVTVDQYGRWLATLAPRQACKVGKVMEVKGKDEKGAAKTVSFKEVLVGDVWVCSGQSNMHMNIRWGGAYHATELVADAKANAPNFRGINLRREGSFFPASEVSLEGEEAMYKRWSRMGGDERGIEQVAAVGFIFGLQLSKACPDIPMGIISLALGGSRIEPWIPYDGYDGIAGLEEEAAAAELYDFGKPKGRAALDKVLADISAWAKGFEALKTKDLPYPPMPQLPRALGGHGGLYNRMMAPLLTFPFKGVIWYQGESNANDEKYGLKQRALITSYRKCFTPDLPFYFVQLPNYDPGHQPKNEIAMRQYAKIRLLQAQSLDLPLTGMAVTTDTADDNELHPRNKYDVGERLARMALADLYGKKLPNDGRSPLAEKATLSADKSEVTVTFRYAKGGLANGTREIEKAPVLTDAKDVKGVVVTLANGKDVFAESTTIDGETFRIKVDPKAGVKAVRYNCFAYPETHVWSKTSGLPVAPFQLKL